MEIRKKSYSNEYFYNPGTVKDRLFQETGVILSLGRGGLDTLMRGTVVSMGDRVLENGALVESFGEVGRGYRYEGVFCRSVGEYIWPAAAFGRADLGEKVLRFMLSHIPWGQVYVPHTFGYDGRLMGNCLQVDSIGHAFYGMYHLWLFTGELSLFKEYKKFFDDWLQTLTWLVLPEFNLVHSGNMNENIDGSAGTMCELFTNATILYGLRSLDILMEAVGDSKRGKICRDLAVRIKDGIETHLKYGRPEMYQVGFWVDEDRTKKPVPDHYFKWLNTYSLRFFPDCDQAALANTHEELVRRSLARFGNYEVPMGYSPPEYSLIGKYAGWYLGYTAQTGRMKDLETMLRFVSEYTKKPCDIWPEGWLLKGCEWVKNESCHREAGWTTFEDNPDGDYTMDSGNAEQLILSMEHIVRHVIGVDLRNGKPGIHPAWPLNWGEVDIDGMMLPDGNGKAGAVGYNLRQTQNETELTIRRMPKWDMEVSLPVRKDCRHKVRIDGIETLAAKMETGKDADRVYFAIRNKSSVTVEVEYE
jgi:hypothetical protein